MDRKTYMELESSKYANENPWPNGSIIIISLDLAKRLDMANKIVKVNWDLVIFDQSNKLETGARLELVQKMIKSNLIKKLLLLSSVDFEINNSLIKKRKINLNDLINYKTQFINKTKKNYELLNYIRSKEEIIFLDELIKINDKLNTNQLLYSASSSIYATENYLRLLIDKLRPLRNKLAHAINLSEIDFENLSILINNLNYDYNKNIKISNNNLFEIYNQLDILIRYTEEIPLDTKLQKLIQYIKKINYENKINKFICIWSSFTDTAEYLKSNLNELGIPVFLLTDRINYNEILSQKNSFNESGGIMITTDISIETESKLYVEELINYELPYQLSSFEKRTNLCSAKTIYEPIKILAFNEKTKSSKWEENLLQKYHNYFVNE